MDIDGRVSAYAPGAEEVVFLNETASQVWRLLDGTRDLDELVREISTGYDVQPADIKDDVARTVQSLVEAGLIAHTGRR